MLNEALGALGGLPCLAVLASVVREESTFATTSLSLFSSHKK